MSARQPNGEPYRSGFHVLRSTPPRQWYRGVGAQCEQSCFCIFRINSRCCTGGRIAPYTILQFYAWERLCSLFGIRAV